MRLHNKKIPIKWALLLMSIPLLYACASSTLTKPAQIEINVHAGFIHEYDDFVIVKSIPGDTLEALAARFLNDPSSAWVIADFNDIETLQPGKEIVIPLKPIHLGGLKMNKLQKVPILLYHDFSRTRSSKMKVLESSFEAQMKYLKENNYNVITLDRFLNFMEYKEPIPDKSVVIAIDDGWKSLYTIAFPILKKYQFPATLFVYTDFIGGKKALTWNQIKELAEYGFDIQCHTKTHRYLTKTKEGETFNQLFKSIEEEIRYPKKLLRKKINRDCNCLAYPYGKTSSLVAAMLKKHGYRAAFTVTRGGNPFFLDSYNINRSAIYGHYDLEKFKKNLDVFQPMQAVTTHKTIMPASQEKSTAAAKTGSRAYLSKALEYENQGDLRMALYYLEIAANISPEERQIAKKLDDMKNRINHKANFHFKEGLKLYQHQQLEKARQAFLKTLVYKPQHTEALFYLKSRFSPFKIVTVKAKKGETKKDIANKVFLDPDKAFLISYFFEETGNQETLKKTMQLELPYVKSAPVKPKTKPTQQSKNATSPYQIEESSPPAFNIQSELALADDLLKNKRYDDVLLIADKIFEYDNFSKDAEGLINQVYFQKGNDLFAEKRYLEARTYFSFIDTEYIATEKIQMTIKSILDRQAEVHYLKGVNYFINEDLDNAIVAWETVLKLNPDHEKAKTDIQKAKHLLEKLQNLE